MNPTSKILKQHFVLSVLAVTTLVPSLVGSNDVSSDLDLWHKSLSIMQENGLWFPGEASVQKQIIDQEGNLQLSESSEFMVAKGQSIEEPVVSCTTTTGDCKTKAAQDLMLNLMHNMGLGVPYFVDPESLYVENRNESKSVNGETTQGFNFRAFKDGRHFAGTVWIETETATPRIIEMRLSEDEPIRLKKFEINHFYRTIYMKQNEGVINPEQITSETWISNRRFLKRDLSVWKYQARLANHWRAI